MNKTTDDKWLDKYVESVNGMQFIPGKNFNQLMAEVENMIIEARINECKKAFKNSNISVVSLELQNGIQNMLRREEDLDCIKKGR